MTRHKLLIISAYYAPAARIGARRAEKFAEAFLRQGWEVDVLSLDAANNSPVDESLKGPESVGRLAARPWVNPAKLSGLFNRTVWQTAAGRSRLARGLFRSAPAKLLMRLAASLGVTSPFFSWERPALRALDGRRYSAVLASVPPSSAALIAARQAQRSGALLYVDYRDPWFNLNFYEKRSKLARHFLELNADLERSCINAARRVVTVSPTLGRWAEEKTKTPVYVLPHGYVAAPPQEPYPGELDLPDLSGADDAIVFYYVGALLYDRDLGPLFALARAIERDTGRRCRVLYSGVHDELARRQAEKVGAADLLVSTGAIPHPQVNDLTRRVTANVVVISSGYEYQYPGKLWDAVSARRPIIVMGAEDCDSAQFVRDQGLGVVISPSSSLEAEAVLQRLQESAPRCASNRQIAAMTTDRLYRDFVETVTEDVTGTEDVTAT